MLPQMPRRVVFIHRTNETCVFKGSTVNAKIATEHGYLNNRCSKIARSWRQMYAQYAMPLTMASSFVTCNGGDSGQSFE